MVVLNYPVWSGDLRNFMGVLNYRPELPLQKILAGVIIE